MPLSEVSSEATKVGSRSAMSGTTGLRIVGTKMAKAYNGQYVFRGLDVHITENSRWAILGENGSGKSTLLKSLCGFTDLTSGRLEYFLDGVTPVKDHWYKYFVGIAPYLHFEDMMEITHFVRFFFQFKRLQPGLPKDALELLAHYGFEEHARKRIGELSSGLLQRLKLIVAFSSATPLLLLDEPCSNLDASGVSWYRALIQQMRDRTVVVASNREEEYDFCEQSLSIADYKV